MLPKRKLIKKVRSQQKNNLNIQQTQVQFHQTLFEKLKSINPALKQQAVTILANLHVPMAEFFQPQFSRELVNLLYQANNSLVYQTLFAMANLCEIQPALVRRFFENGLDKALMHLPSTNNELLRPILVFFITVCENLPQKYQYLLQGIRNSLSVDHIKSSSQLCLQFLFRTYNLSSQKLSQQIINSIIQIFKTSESISQKSYSIAIISKQLQGNKQIQQILLNYMTELIVCIDLAKQYEMNFGMVKHQNKQLMKQSGVNQDLMQQDQQQNQKKHKHYNLSPADRQKLKFFNQNISGIQILLQFILDVLQKQDQDWFQQDQNDEQEQQDKMAQQQKPNQQSQIKVNQKNSHLKHVILNFIGQNMSIFPKFLSLSSTIVPDSQNIVYLFYHLLMHIDKHLQSATPNNNQNLSQINQLIQVSLDNLFGSIQQSKSQQQSGVSFEQYQILVQCLQIGLGVLMRNKGVGVSEEWLIRFSRAHMLQSQIFKSLKLLQQIKPCWMIMLQLYSRVLNPQKNKNITPQQNYSLGEILKQLIISLPYTELQQFRCQVIDSLFDVYSNQRFDDAFVKLGFMELLEAVVKQGNGVVKQSKGKNKKKQKFVKDVLKDIRRFIEYKHKMIQK